MQNFYENRLFTLFSLKYHVSTGNASKIPPKWAYYSCLLRHAAQVHALFHDIPDFFVQIHYFHGKVTFVVKWQNFSPKGDFRAPVRKRQLFLCFFRCSGLPFRRKVSFLAK